MSLQTIKQHPIYDLELQDMIASSTLHGVIVQYDHPQLKCQVIKDKNNKNVTKSNNKK